MATRNETHVHDLSTFANFKDWASSIGAALGAFGWTQSNDSGQVVWTATVLTLTQVAVGATAVYSYSSFTGPSPRVGMSVIFSGFTNGGNNVTATLTAVSGGASGTVTVALTTQVNETHAGSGTTTAQSTVPTSGNSVFEIWQPGDGLTTFFVRFDYKNNGGSSPQILINIGSSSNGSGTLSGTTLTQFGPDTATNSGATLFNCLFSGGTGWFSMMMWRDANGIFNQFLAIERSKDSSGNDTSSYVSFVNGALLQSGNRAYFMQHLVFGVSATNQYSANKTIPGLFPSVAQTINGVNQSMLFNGNTGMTPYFPFVGYFDNPGLGGGMASATDFTELATISTTIYGATHTFLLSKNQQFALLLNLALLMRWE